MASLYSGPPTAAAAGQSRFGSQPRSGTQATLIPATSIIAGQNPSTGRLLGTFTRGQPTPVPSPENTKLGT